MQNPEKKRIPLGLCVLSIEPSSAQVGLFCLQGLEVPRQRQWLSSGLGVPILSLEQETHLNLQNRHDIRVKDWQKIFQSNGPKKHAGVAILISNKFDLKQNQSKEIEKDTLYS